jgi:hypothetical protein
MSADVSTWPSTTGFEYVFDNTRDVDDAAVKPPADAKTEVVYRAAWWTAQQTAGGTHQLKRTSILTQTHSRQHVCNAPHLHAHAVRC